jgi:hypothetical protein
MDRLLAGSALAANLNGGTCRRNWRDMMNPLEEKCTHMIAGMNQRTMPVVRRYCLLAIRRLSQDGLTESAKRIGNDFNYLSDRSDWLDTMELANAMIAHYVPPCYVN